MRRRTILSYFRPLRTRVSFTMPALAVAAGIIVSTATSAGIAGEAPAQAAGDLATAGAQTDKPGRVTTLFVIGPNMGFVGFDKAATLSGSKVPVTTELLATNQGVSRPRGAVLDARGALYLISGARRGSIAVYDDPLKANGSRQPDRAVFGERTQISRSPTGIAIDRGENLLYLANARTGLLVFDISTPEAFNGDVAPVRAFDVDLPQFRPEQLRFANGSLYVVDARGGTSDILVFDNPGKLRGKVTPDRTISYGGFDNKVGVDIDSKNRLLVSVRKLGQVLIFTDASKLDGVAQPDVTLSIAGAKVSPQPSFATTDSEDRLYVADSSGNVVFSFDETSKLTSGERYPARTINSRDLIAPHRLLLFER